MTEELGIIKSARIGNRDVGVPVLWMEIEVAHGAFLTVLRWGKAYDLIKDSGVHNFTSLIGKGVIVESNGVTSHVVRLKG